jgi:DNA ligase 1
MKQFSELFRSLDETNRTTGKVSALVDYFNAAPPADAAWAVALLLGRRPKRPVSGPKMAAWAAEAAGIPSWLYDECYSAVGDSAETISLVVPTSGPTADEAGLAEWIESRILPLAGMQEEMQRESLTSYWRALTTDQKFVFNKLITGAFRVGVSQELVVRALAQVGGVPVPVVAHRMMGDWSPSAEFYRSLFFADTGETDVSRPYPFALAHSLEQAVDALGGIEDWCAEWKWDGIRSQVIRRAGQSFVWSRGEELISDRFPEVSGFADWLPEGTVIDGEILAWGQGRPRPFQDLQRRIGRKTVGKKLLAEVPVVLLAFDLLEFAGSDLRELPFVERRRMLQELVERQADPALQISPSVEAASWEELARLREDSREHGVEGLMLKRADAPYVVGRKRGVWWKWKVTPLTVDAVLVYAQRGSGKRASLYTDYTFALWRDGALVPFAKAYSGLTDEEIQRVDAFVRRNTQEKFGPVRTVKPELVMELAFEGIQVSSRHKSGIAVRFPRIARWRHDKTPEQADSLDTVKAMLKGA